ncbi:lipoprotein-releasing system permease protein [Salinimicrobium catena]|uniref:Lipoprotein-releasing system permease protein n=1 Tax=Salinimicrobium catena TaxID=390640 RepID=A0A1H5N0N2_9FLAO|nr:FtsX-like permease family protein [Salinimicrobium catena]SDL33886.1 lipoprotein-releasing system permease protein [Salinimicrobium catena]SEE95066.1 lipoprotein-releasing system permease protein [Salinimicrobium catena]
MIQRSVIMSIAKTHLLSKLKQTIIAALGVTFGIGSYITLVSFMTGLNNMLDDLILNQTPHIHIYNEIQPSKQQPVDIYEALSGSLNMVRSIKPKQTQKKIHNAQPLIDLLEKDPRVRGALPQVKTQIFYIAGPIDLGGNLTGVNILQEAELSNLGDYIVEGSPQDLENTANAIILGSGVAEKMSLEIGERVQVNTVQGELFPLKVVGIYQSGISDIDNIQSYTNLKTAQKILGQPENYITDINVKLYDTDDAVGLAKKIEEQYGLRAVDVQTANAQFETGNTVRNLISYSVSVTLLLVAGFGIYNILNMLIYEKMNDIAILKATGFTGRDVQWVFMSQALIIGIIGGVTGLLVGYLLSVVISNTPFETEALPTIETYPVNFDPWFYIIGISFAIVATFLAGYLPSKRAKKIDPVRIINRL